MRQVETKLGAVGQTQWQVALPVACRAVHSAARTRGAAQASLGSPEEAPSSSHASWRSFTARRARHTAELHLKPEPKAICQTRSPLRTPRLVSMLDSTYL